MCNCSRCAALHIQAAWAAAKCRLTVRGVLHLAPRPSSNLHVGLACCLTCKKRLPAVPPQYLHTPNWDVHEPAGDLCHKVHKEHAGIANKVMREAKAYLSCFFAIFRSPIALTIANCRHHIDAAESSSACDDVSPFTHRLWYSICHGPMAHSQYDGLLDGVVRMCVLQHHTVRCSSPTAHPGACAG